MARFGFGFGINSIQGQFAPIVGTKQNFTTLVAADSKHFTMSAITLTGAFVIEYDAVFTGSATAVVLGNSASSTDYTSCTNVGKIRLRVNSLDLTTVTAALDSKLRHVKIERDGSNNITVTVEGFTPENLGTSAGDFTVDLVGKAGFGNPWAGILANVSITDVADRRRFFKINETWVGPSTVLVDYGSDGSNGTAVNITSADSDPFTKSGNDWFGLDKWINPPPIFDSAWNDDGGGQYTLTGTGGSEPLGINVGVGIGQSFRIGYNLVSASANMKVQSPSEEETMFAAQLGARTLTLATGSTFIQFARVSGVTNCVLKDISFKRILEGV